MQNYGWKPHPEYSSWFEPKENQHVSLRVVDYGFEIVARCVVSGKNFWGKEIRKPVECRIEFSLE